MAVNILTVPTKCCILICLAVNTFNIKPVWLLQTKCMLSMKLPRFFPLRVCLPAYGAWNCFLRNHPLLSARQYCGNVLASAILLLIVKHKQDGEYLYTNLYFIITFCMASMVSFLMKVPVSLHVTLSAFTVVCYKNYVILLFLEGLFL